MVVRHDYERFPELSNKQLEEFGFTSPHVQITEDFWGVVEKVTDGDTVTLLHPQRDFSFPFRLLDIDAPELSEGGEKAKSWLATRLTGQEVYVVINPRMRVGKYGRLLGKIIHRGLDVGDEMLAMGLVAEFGAKNEHLPQPLDKIYEVKI